MKKAIQYLIKTYGEITVQQNPTDSTITEVIYYADSFAQSDLWAFPEGTAYFIYPKNDKLKIKLYFKDESSN